MKMLTIESRWVIQFPKSKHYLVDAPPTGFKSTTKHTKAMRFETQEELQRYASNRGVFVFQPILIHFDK